MQFLKADNSSIAIAADIINRGGLVAFPTETVYGLGADGLNPIAVASIFEAKGRPMFNPLILHIAEKDDIYKICEVNNPFAEKLIEKFWPGPLTLVLPKKNIVPDITTSGNTTVAVRMPNHPVALELIKKAGKPLAAPSANAYGRLSPTNAGHVLNQLGNKPDIILDGGDCSIGVESTIIYLGSSIKLLRHGGTAIEEIEKITGRLQENIHSLKPDAPGQLPYHYAPSVKIKFININEKEAYKSMKTSAVFFSKPNSPELFKSVKVLSPSGNMKEAAANLFKVLHELESEDVDLIVVEPVEETGLGKAVMDRLKRAVKKYS